MLAQTQDDLPRDEHLQGMCGVQIMEGLPLGILHRPRMPEVNEVLAPWLSLISMILKKMSRKTPSDLVMLISFRMSCVHQERCPTYVNPPVFD
jgi:hypothetical protein